MNFFGFKKVDVYKRNNAANDYKDILFATLAHDMIKPHISVVCWQTFFAVDAREFYLNELRRSLYMASARNADAKDVGDGKRERVEMAQDLMEYLQTSCKAYKELKKIMPVDSMKEIKVHMVKSSMVLILSYLLGDVKMYVQMITDSLPQYEAWVTNLNIKQLVTSILGKDIRSQT